MKNSKCFSKTHHQVSQAVSNDIQPFHVYFTEESLSLVHSAIEALFDTEPVYIQLV